MATELEYLTYVTEKLKISEGFSYRKMMGEYLVYFREKLIGGICDNQLFLKDTKEGREYIGKFVLAPMYKGATPSLLIENLEDEIWLNALADITYQALPMPKPKKARKK